MSKTDGIGTWVWNANVNLPVSSSSMVTYDFSFESDLGLCSGIDINFYIDSPGGTMVYFGQGFYTDVYGTDVGWLDDVYRTIDIKTAPPADFLSILQSNATYQEPKLTDLTGTTWKWNETPTIDFDEIMFSLNFSSDGGVYTELLIGSYADGSKVITYDDLEAYVDIDYSWYNQQLRLISITGGPDATSTDLINYMYANAELQGSASTKYKVNVALEHCTRIGGDLEVEQGQGGYVAVQCDTGYVLRNDKVKITNANFDRITDELDTTGASIGQYKIYFSNATGEVTVSAIATIKSYKLRANGIYVRANGQTSGVMTLKEYKDGTLLRTMNYNWDNSDVVPPSS